jgi:hypothetical protein
MLKRALFLAFVLVTSSTAYGACEGQPGEVIFEDAFADDTGGWSFDPDATVANDELSLHLEDPNTSWVFWNNTFNATEGDFCAEVVQPTSPANDNLAAVGLSFLITDADNYFLLQLSSDSTVTMWRKAGGQWSQIGDYPSDGMNLTPGQPATLRAVIGGGVIKPSVNGVELRGVRAQMPEGPQKFGVYAQVDQALPSPGIDFVFKGYKVTSGI